MDGVDTIRSLDVIMPVFNEEATVAQAAERLLATPAPGGLRRRLVIVNDGSTDATRDLVNALADGREDVEVVHHPVRRGKGAAIRTALERSDSDVVLVHDADLEYDPADHAGVLEPILAGRAEVVIGSRFLGRSHRVLYYWHAVANRIITTLSNMLTNLNLTDIECCTKAMTRDVRARLTIREDGFGVEPEIVAKVARMRLDGGRRVRVYEVPVAYSGRTYEEGKKIGVADGLRAVWCILRYGLGSPGEPASQPQVESRKST